MLVLAFTISQASYAEVGDQTPINVNQIVEIKQETSTTKSGKEKVETIVIYKDAQGKRKLAYMTSTDYKKLQQAKQYNLDIEYILVEMKTKTKLVVK